MTAGQAIAASIEAIAYVVVAAAVLRNSSSDDARRGRLRFAWWWRLNAIGVAMTPIQVLVFAFASQSPWAWFATVSVALVASSIGTALVTDHLRAVVIGDRWQSRWLYAAFAVVGVATIVGLAMARPTSVAETAGFIAPTYASPPGTWTVMAQSLLILPPLALATWLAAISPRLTGPVAMRARLLAAATWLWFISKAMIGIALSNGDITTVAFVGRALGLAAAGAGLAAYLRR